MQVARPEYDIRGRLYKITKRQAAKLIVIASTCHFHVKNTNRRLRIKDMQSSFWVVGCSPELQDNSKQTWTLWRSLFILSTWSSIRWLSSFYKHSVPRQYFFLEAVRSFSSSSRLSSTSSASSSLEVNQSRLWCFTGYRSSAMPCPTVWIHLPSTRNARKRYECASAHDRRINQSAIGLFLQERPNFANIGTANCAFRLLSDSMATSSHLSFSAEK